VGADGGPSGLSSLTVADGSGPPRPTGAGQTVGIDGDGQRTVTAVAVDGAGNRSETARVVRVDRTPPSARLTCARRAGAKGYRCQASGADAASGVAALRWRVDGGAWHAPSADGAFSVGSGRVQVRAVDRAGLVTVSAATTLGKRLPVRMRTRTLPISLHGAKGAGALLGSLELRVVRDATGRSTATADLRPLAVGKGRYRTTIVMRSGGLKAERRRSVTLRRGGVTPRLALALSRVRRPTRVQLRVDRRAGRRWVGVAVVTASVKLPAQAG
jgi:hypothetical protein